MKVPFRPMRLVHGYWTLCCLSAALFVFACKGGQAEEKKINPNASSAELTDYTPPSPIHLTDIKVDSLFTIPFQTTSSFHGGSFRFSPFDRHKIWVTPDGQEAFELDIKSGNKLPFSARFSTPFFRDGLPDHAIFPDRFEPDVCWFLNFQRGVFRYDNAKQTGEWFEAGTPYAAVSTLYCTENQVWIGTSRNLFVYERSNGQCHPVERSPDLWISRLSLDHQGRIIVNHRYAYDPGSQCWEDVKSYRGLSLDSIDNIYEIGGYALIQTKVQNTLIISPKGDYKYLSSNLLEQSQVYPEPPFAWLSKGLNLLDIGAGKAYPHQGPSLPFSGFYKYANAPEEIWRLSGNYWSFLDKATRYFHTLVAPLKETPLSVAADSDFLYVLLSNRLIIYNKQYLKKRAKGDEIAKNIHLFKRVCDSIQIEKQEDWPSHLIKLAFLKQQFQHLGDPYIADAIARYSVRHIDCFNEKELRSLLADQDVDQYLVYDCLIGLLVRQHRLKEAVKYSKVLRTIKPTGKVGHAIDLQALTFLESTVYRLDSLDAAGLAPDTLLLAKAGVLQKLCETVFFEGEACYSYGLADSVYQLLIRRHPQSALADNAAYCILDHRYCFEGEDGSDHPDVVKDYQNFIRRYPDSELKPDALCAAAWALGRSEADLRKGLRWIEEAESIKPNLFSGKFFNMKEQFDEALIQYDLGYSIQSKNNRIPKGAPVNIVFTLKNKSTRYRKTSLYKNGRYPGFAVEVLPVYPDSLCIKPPVFIYENNAAFKIDGKNSPIVLEPHGTLYETWDLCKTARRPHDAGIGRYDLERGIYNIKAFYSNGSELLETNTIRIEIY